MKDIRYYVSPNGKCFVTEFLDKLNKKVITKFVWTLQLIIEEKNIPDKYFKKLKNTNDIWEVRVNYDGNAYRFLGFLDGETLIILNHAFAKKSQKTPTKEIRTAEKRKEEYYERT